MSHSHDWNLELLGEYHLGVDGRIIGMHIRWHEPPDVQMVEPIVVFAHDVCHSSYTDAPSEFVPEYLGVAGTRREACGLIEARYAEQQGS